MLDSDDISCSLGTPSKQDSHNSAGPEARRLDLLVLQKSQDMQSYMKQSFAFDNGWEVKVPLLIPR